MLFVNQKRDTLKSRRRRRLLAESLETRAMLTTFYVDAEFGAAGNDGTAQSPFASITEGIQAAMQSTGADEVIIAPRAAGGAYNESVSLQSHGTDDSPIVLRGATGNATDVLWTSAEGPGLLVDAAIELTIQDLKFEGTELAGIRVVSEADVTVDNVHVQGSRRNSGIVHQNGDLVVRNSLLENNFQGLWSAELRDDVSSEIVDYPDNLTVENTISANNNANGIYSRNATGDVVLENVQATDNRFNGVRVWQINLISINDGEYSGNGYSGISIEDSESPTLRGGVMSGNGHHGVWGRNNQSPSIGGGEMTDNLLTGIHLSGSSDVTITDTLVNGNEVHGIKIVDADGVLIDQVTATENGSIFSNSTSGGGGIGVLPSTAAPIVITNSVVSRNQTRGNGGGIEVWAWSSVNYNFMSEVYISNTEVTGNQIAPDVFRHGGGVAIFGSANSTFANVLVEGNVARGTAGLHSYTGFSTPEGFPTMTVTDSTIAHNVALREGPGIGAGAAGIYHGNGHIELSNTTIYENDGGNAGGMYLASIGGNISNTTISGNNGVIVGGMNSRVVREDLNIRNVTIVENHGGNAGGVTSLSSKLNFGNSIVAENTRGDSNDGSEDDRLASDVAGTATTLGGNFFGEADNVDLVGSGQDQTGTQASPLDPQLGSLQDNGGATLTHAPLPGSPVVDGGVDALVELIATDQRGADRVQGNAVDIGAVEQTVFHADVEIPKSHLNLNSADKGNKTVSVVIHSTNQLDATLIDASTVVWASASASGFQLRDVDGDGDLDLIVDFKLRETDLVDRYRDALILDDSDNQVSVDVPVSGMTDDGLRVMGSGSVDLVMTGKALRDLLRSIDES
ncbi:right-handed parallel beta-helix repeat-containing protein [Novipirellula caenicola]|uniref:Right handed beta helix domain-containing protein n=1 Tax=Novipirellula caenicola TaxID=1536901 RepID=A0ABP9VNX7_9BACT